MTARNSSRPVIGVVGGMGPYAGVDLVKKIFDETEAAGDQEHVPVALFSFPDRIADRSAFLLGNSDINPADSLAEIATMAHRAGASVIGIPCNTAHAEPIFDDLLRRLAESNIDVHLLHIVAEAVRYVREALPTISTVGVLSTLATYRFKLYDRKIEAAGLRCVTPDDDVKIDVINKSIFEPPHGIKAQSNPISPVARDALIHAIRHLKERGAEAVILGCTELPLAVTEPEIEGLPIVDPTRILARALLRETYPERMKPQ